MSWVITGKKKGKHSRGAWFASVAVAVFLVVDLLPLYFVAANSFKNKSEYIENVYNLPSKFDLANYIKLMEEYDFPKMFLNSLLLTVSTIIICGYLGTMAAFAVGKFRFRGRRLVAVFILPFMSIPSIVLLIPINGVEPGAMETISWVVK